MNHNPNEGPLRAGPLVVYGSDPTPTPAPASTGLLVEVLASALLGAALATAVTLALTGSVETPPCDSALAAADDMAYVSAEVGRTADAVAAGDDVDMDAVRDDWNTAFDAYEAAAAACREAGA